MVTSPQPARSLPRTQSGPPVGSLDGLCGRRHLAPPRHRPAGWKRRSSARCDLGREQWAARSP